MLSCDPFRHHQFAKEVTGHLANNEPGGLNSIACVAGFFKTAALTPDLAVLSTSGGR